MTELAALLLDWFDRNRRQFPFRGTHDPYRVWISEIMLQQTRTETVTPYYERFLRAFPDVFSLAAAPEQEVLKAWEGLGYYSRARNLRRAAIIVAEQMDGVFPDTVEGLLALPGIGPYTAGAIASIAYDLPVPAMDGNLIRVFARLFGVRESVSREETKKRLYSIASQHMPMKRSGELNQAFMDLGAGICKPVPDCASCPLSGLCGAHQAGDADALPVKDSKKPPSLIRYDVLLIEADGRICMLKRREKMLNGLWVYPMLEGENSAADIAAALAPMPVSVRPEPIGEARHVFTHRVWQMRIWHVRAADTAAVPPLLKDAQWMTAREMADVPRPTAIKAAYAHASRLV